MRKHLILVILLVFFLAFNLFAETSIKAEVSKKSITTDEAITYKIVISSSEKSIPTPQFPKLEGFQVISRANSTSFNFSANGVKNSFVFIFVLAPTKTGELSISPVTLKINNETYSTESFKIEVKQGKRKPQPEQKKSLPPGISSNPEETTL